MAIKRRNPGWRTMQDGKRVYTRSEEEAWKHVRDIARRIPGHTRRASGLGGMPAIDTLADELLDLASDMLAQLKIGIHENPPLVVMGFNPPPKGATTGVVSHRVYAIEYKHLEDNNDYRHDFAAGVNLFVDRKHLQVTLYRPDGKPLAKDFVK